MTKERLDKMREILAQLTALADELERSADQHAKLIAENRVLSDAATNATRRINDANERIVEFDRINKLMGDKNARLAKDLAEEHRLSGMGQERELRLMARLDEAEKRIADMVAAYRTGSK